MAQCFLLSLILHLWLLSTDITSVVISMKQGYDSHILGFNVHLSISLDRNRNMALSDALHPKNRSSCLLWVSLVILSAPNHLCCLASVPVATVLAAELMITPSLCGRAVETDGSSEQGRNCQSGRGGLNTRLEWIKSTPSVSSVSEVKRKCLHNYPHSGSS